MGGSLLCRRGDAGQARIHAGRTGWKKVLRAAINDYVVWRKIAAQHHGADVGAPAMGDLIKSLRFLWTAAARSWAARSCRATRTLQD
jgi:hypothetical protein